MIKGHETLGHETYIVDTNRRVWVQNLGWGASGQGLDLVQRALEGFCAHITNLCVTNRFRM